MGPAGALPLGLGIYFAVEKHKGNKFLSGEPWRAEGAALNPSLPLGFTSLVAAGAPCGGVIVTAVIPPLTSDTRIKYPGECFCHHQPSWTNQELSESNGSIQPNLFTLSIIWPHGNHCCSKGAVLELVTTTAKEATLKNNLSHCCYHNARKFTPAASLGRCHFGCLSGPTCPELHPILPGQTQGSQHPFSCTGSSAVSLPAGRQAQPWRVICTHPWKMCIKRKTHFNIILGGILSLLSLWGGRKVLQHLLSWLVLTTSLLISDAVPFPCQRQNQV